MEEKKISQEDLVSFLEDGIQRSMQRHRLELTIPAQEYLVEMLGRFAETFGLYQERWLTPVTFQYQQISGEMSRLQRSQLQRELFISSRIFL